MSENSDVIYASGGADEVNVIQSISTTKKIVFQESYTIVGRQMEAREIHANYDLFVIGNLKAESIAVLGNLVVIGNIKADKLSCSNKVTCQGEVRVKEIVVDDLLYADEIICDSLTARDVIARKTVDSESFISVRENLIAEDGVIGEGEISASNLIAVNFTDLSGDVQAKVYDLSAPDMQDHEKTDSKDISQETDQFVSDLNKEIENWYDLSEDEFVKNVKDIGQRIPDMTNTSSLINRICELTYKNKIENLLNLLLIVWAKNTFPETIKKYDTIDLVFSTLYEDALSRVNRMPFHADNLEDVSIALYIAEKYKDDLPLPFEVAADKILSEIGLRYSTAEQLLDE